MTLTTTVRIYDPAPLDDLWDSARELVGSTAATQWKDVESVFGGGIRFRHNQPGQGCAALLVLTYSADGFLPVDEEDGRDRPCVYEVSFDTPYGAPNCGHLQAFAVTALAAWLDDRGARWEWHDEFRNEWHATLDAVPERLGDTVLAFW